MRTKYEQIELKLNNVKDSLLREIVNTRNPRVHIPLFFILRIRSDMYSDKFGV